MCGTKFTELDCFFTKNVYSFGFINFPALLIFIPITTIMAKVGANTVNKIDKSKVQTFFGIFLYIVGTVFIYRYLNI